MYTHEEFIAQIATIHPDIVVIGKYTGITNRIKVQCKNCQLEWEPLAYSLKAGKSCPHCSAKRGAMNNTGKTGLKTLEQFTKEMYKKHPDIQISGDYVNGHTNVVCFCSVCNHQWEAKPYSLLQGHGCPRCAKSGTSFMEQFIKISFERVLGKNSVLSRNKSTIGMELDIVIPDLQVAIEPGNWFLHKKSLKRDIEKRKRCSDKGIRLITIYDKFPQNEEIPFETDCFVFQDDLNKTDRNVIISLVKKLLSEINVSVPSDIDWKQIEAQAYDNAKAKTHDDFVQEMALIHPTIEILEKYQNSNKRIHVQCKKCGYEWNGVPANMLAGDGCRKCGTKTAHAIFIKSQLDFEKEVAQANPDIEILGTYIGRHSPVRARCRICGYVWEPQASSLLRGSNHKGWQSIHKKLL